MINLEKGASESMWYAVFMDVVENGTFSRDFIKCTLIFKHKDCVVEIPYKKNDLTASVNLFGVYFKEITIISEHWQRIIELLFLREIMGDEVKINLKKKSYKDDYIHGLFKKVVENGEFEIDYDWKFYQFTYEGNVVTIPYDINNLDNDYHVELSLKNSYQTKVVINQREFEIVQEYALLSDYFDENKLGKGLFGL